LKQSWMQCQENIGLTIQYSISWGSWFRSSPPLMMTKPWQQKEECVNTHQVCRPLSETLTHRNLKP
jgi:hypothetical protein